MMNKYVQARLHIVPWTDEICVMIFKSYEDLLNYLSMNGSVLKDYEEISIVRHKKGVKNV